MIDGHMHTPLCKHAFGEPEEYAEAARRRGLRAITFTCHSPMPDGWWPQVRMDDAQFEAYAALVDRAAAAYGGVLDVRLGIESDWFPGMEGWLEKLHRRVPLHHVLGSVHFFGLAYMEKFFHGDVPAFYRQYFDSLAESAETGLFDTLAHPDLVKNFRPEEWSFRAHEQDIAVALDRIAKTGVAMELNTSGLHKRYSEMNPSLPMLHLMQERGIPVVIGSDAHVARRVAAGFETALDLVERAGYAEVSYFINRTRHALPLAEARASLREPMPG